MERNGCYFLESTPFSKRYERLNSPDDSSISEGQSRHSFLQSFLWPCSNRTREREELHNAGLFLNGIHATHYGQSIVNYGASSFDFSSNWENLNMMDVSGCKRRFLGRQRLEWLVPSNWYSMASDDWIQHESTSHHWGRSSKTHIPCIQFVWCPLAFSFTFQCSEWCIRSQSDIRMILHH